MTHINWRTAIVAVAIAASGATELLTAAAAVPKFADFPVTEIFKGKPAPPVLSTPEARRFRSQLRTHAAFGADFAGHFKLARWGCGAGCVFVAVLDSITGDVYFAPFSFQDAYLPRPDGQPKILCNHSSDYQLDSELFIAEGAIGDKIGTHFYRWHDRQFTLVHFEPSCGQGL
jgi:hypothetical protein